MFWRLLVVTLLFSQSSTGRNLAPQPEPDVHGAVVATVYLPIVLTASEVTGAITDRPIYGYASPHRRRYNVPYYNWGQYPKDCLNPNYWPMARGQMSYDITGCDDGQRTLLLYNEPELGSFSATPKQAVAFVDSWLWWSGPIACCGNFYGDGGGDLTGLQWFLSWIVEYHRTHGTVPPIDAIHLHVYEQDALDLPLLALWRDVADAYGWRIIVSESGVSPHRNTPYEVAQKLPAFLAEVETVLQPDVLMWFSDYITDAFGDGTPWHHLNLTDIDGNLTAAGQAWEFYTQTSIDGARE